MATTPMYQVMRHLKQALAPRADGAVPDADLLQRFTAARDEAAFELLVCRHHRLVLGVCGRLLADTNDVEDAFQATFLTLARHANAIRRRDSLASWLYGVARR